MHTWKFLCVSKCATLIKTMPQGMHAVIKAKGALTWKDVSSGKTDLYMTTLREWTLGGILFLSLSFSLFTSATPLLLFPCSSDNKWSASVSVISPLHPPLTGDSITHSSLSPSPFPCFSVCPVLFIFVAVSSFSVLHPSLSLALVI